MKRLAFLMLLAACTPARTRRAVDPQALRGVKLGLPVPADARPTPGIGCGQISQDLPSRAYKALVASFSDAGAETSNSDRACVFSSPSVASRSTTVSTQGARSENTHARRTDRPPSSPV